MKSWPGAVIGCCDWRVGSCRPNAFEFSCFDICGELSALNTVRAKLVGERRTNEGCAAKISANTREFRSQRATFCTARLAPIFHPTPHSSAAVSRTGMYTHYTSSMQKATTLDPQLTGNVGLYYCCYKLSMMGWNVMPTARNARGVDIIAYSRDATRFVGIQVKTLSKRKPVPLGNSRDKVMGDFWIVINKVATTPSAFVLIPSEVKALARKSEKDGKVAYWLQPPDYDAELFHENWDRIGSGA